MTTMTIEELLAEVQASYQGDEGLTCPEWAERMRVSQITARKRLKALIDAGKMVTGRGNRPSMDGRMFLVPVYRLV